MIAVSDVKMAAPEIQPQLQDGTFSLFCSSLLEKNGHTKLDWILCSSLPPILNPPATASKNEIFKLSKTITNLEDENSQLKGDKQCAIDQWTKSVSSIDDLKHKLEVKESKVKMEKT